jgi:metal-dependent amidase/aminoacylase/carboxypeptidase family protein
MRVKPGALMAHVAEFKVTIQGKGGHGSQPHVCVDPVVCGAAVVAALQTIVSRSLHYKDAAVVSVCTHTHTHTRTRTQKRVSFVVAPPRLAKPPPLVPPVRLFRQR